MTGRDLIDNDGYYQDVDDARYCHLDDEDMKPKKEREYKLRMTPERYAAIEYNPMTRHGRRTFVEERHKIHEAAAAKYREDVANGTYSNLPATQVFCACKTCGGGFVAKVADRKRGWARYCSKSCKAQGN